MNLPNKITTVRIALIPFIIFFYLSTPFFHSVRINGAIGTEGIVQAINHPWYFNK